MVDKKQVPCRTPAWISFLRKAAGLSTNLLHRFEDLKRTDIFSQNKVLGEWGKDAGKAYVFLG